MKLVDLSLSIFFLSLGFFFCCPDFRLDDDGGGLAAAAAAAAAVTTVAAAALASFISVVAAAVLTAAFALDLAAANDEDVDDKDGGDVFSSLGLFDDGVVLSLLEMGGGDVLFSADTAVATAPEFSFSAGGADDSF